MAGWPVMSARRYSSSCFWETLEKIESDLQGSTQTEGCIELPCVAMSSIWPNISALSDPHSLFVSLTSLLILDQDHLNKIPFQALVDSGSTHCFVDSKFVNTHYLKTSTTPLVAFYLFDGSSNSIISEIVSQIRYSLVVILELNDVSEVQYKGMMTDRLLWQPLDTKSNDHTTSKSLKADI